MRRVGWKLKWNIGWTRNIVSLHYRNTTNLGWNAICVTITHYSKLIFNTTTISLRMYCLVSIAALLSGRFSTKCRHASVTATALTNYCIMSTSKKKSRRKVFSSQLQAKSTILIPNLNSTFMQSTDILLIVARNSKNHLHTPLPKIYYPYQSITRAKKILLGKKTKENSLDPIKEYS